MRSTDMSVIGYNSSKCNAITNTIHN